jgi:chloride channel 7
MFKKKDSLSYEEAQSLVWIDRPPHGSIEIWKEWLAYILVGVLIGFISFFMVVCEELLLISVLEKTEKIIESGIKKDPALNEKFIITPWLFYSGCAALYGLLSSLLTTYYGPAATGSGVPELIGYLNGVNQPGFISISSLITKVVGVSLAVSGKLAVGKEGPLAHIGAVAGVLVLYIPFLGFEIFRNDEQKRCFVAAGASAGVSCAFGSPIGGALFAYELSKTNTFWKFEMIWKVFVSCAMATFTLGVCTSFRDNSPIVWGAAVLKFGATPDVLKEGTFSILGSASVILGIIGGLIGPLFITINTKVNYYRKKLLN